MGTAQNTSAVGDRLPCSSGGAVGIADDHGGPSDTKDTGTMLTQHLSGQRTCHHPCKRAWGGRQGKRERGKDGGRERGKKRGKEGGRNGGRERRGRGKYANNVNISASTQHSLHTHSLPFPFVQRSRPQ